jgi:hypothetical protein
MKLQNQKEEAVFQGKKNLIVLWEATPTRMIY